MAGNYAEVAQEDDERNTGASPPISLSPALSSSPMPLLRSADPTFTPVSIDSDSYLNYGQENKLIDNTSRDYDDQERSISPTATAKSEGMDLAQSVTASARATAAPEPAQTEYDLLSPSSGAVDACPAVPGSPISESHNTRSAPKQQQKSAACPTTCSFEGASLKAKITHHRQNLRRTSTEASPPPGGSENFQPTTIVEPKPILRTASTRSVKLVHPSPSVRSRSSSHASNIAQLEATAEKLSLTSSIEDAIRDLHEEQKRSDSRRSSILAATTGFGPDYKEPFPFTRQVSTASSILETNNAARHGGYSPAGYVMSPNHSLLSNPSRLRSASHTRSDADSSELLTRHGPGKSSTRSAKSTTKPSLTDIAEMEPTGLTLAAMDEADKLDERHEEETLRLPPMEDVELTPNADPYDNTHATDYWGIAAGNSQHAQAQHHNEEPGSPTGSVGTFEQVEDAFADFDGAHCSPDDADADDPFQPPFDLDLSLQMPVNERPDMPRISAPKKPMIRPTSYMDPETGQQMMYYPARVPMMLNLPQKLSRNPKAAVRNQRRSQVLSQLPQANRQSAAWLPEVVPEPLVDHLGTRSTSDLSSPLPQPETATEIAPETLSPEYPLEAEVQPRTGPELQLVNEEKRKSRMSVIDPADKRKSRMSYTMDQLPPQLRASAFFDMPSESPQIELKDGSAMATLDSILDASAAAPVSAFTDHAFAGKLGTEVYGVDKRKTHMKRGSTATALEVKKRTSIFHLRTPSKISNKGSLTNEKRDTVMGTRPAGDVEGSDDERTKLSASVDGERVGEQENEEHHIGLEDEDDDEMDSDQDIAAHGPPTTLLAELQLRKHQQKMRTKAPTRLYPNGMHSTLLEIDTVAEMERKNRKGKKINLAWEGGDAGDESDDEDVPLGLLAVKKNGHLGMHTIQQEINRPLGLMEQRNLEDNEPLSRRRERLQGRPSIAPRREMGALGMSGGLGPPSPGLRIQTPEEDENDGETLAQRMRRLRAREDGNNPLPQARPVSNAFSAELLSQIGDAFKSDHDSETNGKNKEKAAAPEEEETLGQRRRRLQAEREAREKEMVAGAGLQLPTEPMLAKRHSMADVLGATRRTVLTDPRADAERTRQEEAARFRHDQDLKLAGFRAQVPTNVSTPNLQRSGGYMAGQYNDGTAGGLGRSRVLNNYGGQAPKMPVVGINGGGMGTMMGNGVYGTQGYSAMPMGYNQNTMGYGGVPLQMQMLQMPMQQPGQQYDRVDRWRQSIVP